MLTREFCSICGNIVRVGFHVPDNIWEQVVHASKINDIHCLECFTKRADEKLIDWSKAIKFYPVSLKKHLDDEGRMQNEFTQYHINSFIWPFPCHYRLIRQLGNCKRCRNRNIIYLYLLGNT